MTADHRRGLRDMLRFPGGKDARKTLAPTVDLLMKVRNTARRRSEGIGWCMPRVVGWLETGLDAPKRQGHQVPIERGL